VAYRRPTGPGTCDVLLLPGALATPPFYDDLLAEPNARFETRPPVPGLPSGAPGFGEESVG
jgi:hypothetical protein